MFDKALVRRWLTIAYGDAPGLVHICATNLWTGRTFPVDNLDAAADYVEQLHGEGREGIYARVTTLAGELAEGSRGGETDTHALTALWADIDVAGPGHKVKGGHTLPPDEAGARAVVALAGLPEPTIWIGSGGGFYPYWLLPAGGHVVDGDLDQVADLSAGWQHALGHAAGILGWHYGTGVGDLARVLRIPGTINRKVGLERPCRIVSATTTRYTIGELYEALGNALAKIPEPDPEPTPRLVSVRADDGSTSPGDDFAAKTEWADILQPHGWRYAYSRGRTAYWRRPGKDTAGTSATTNHLGTDRLKVFTDGSDFEQDASYSKLAAYAVLNHGGDQRAAAKALKDQGFGRPAPLAPDPAATQRAALADLLPRASPSGTVLSAVDGTAARVIAEPAPVPEAYGPTEDGLARALVAHHGHELRYCPQRGQWLAWTGHRWAWDDAGRHRELIKGMARNLPDEKDWRSFQRRAMSAAGVSGVARMAETDAAVTVHVTDLDADPWSLNTPAGIVDLNTGLLGPSDPAKLCTRSTLCAPDPGADAVTWRSFLADTFEDTELIGYVQRLLGYSAVGMVGPHVLPFAFGSGGNGKGVLLEAVAGVLGDYATSAPVSFLMTHTHANHETEIARLAGARMVICSEVNEDDRFDEARIKQLTGGDSLTARFMRQDHFTFTPTHQLWLMGNHKPAVRSGGRAFWRRLRLIPFVHEVPEEKVIDDLQGKLVREYGPAVLAWIVAGAAAYAKGGLQEPATVKTATDEYARDSDTVARFVDDTCHIGGGDAVKIKVAKVREAYERWCTAESEMPVTAKAFGLALSGKRFGVGLTRTKAARFYTNITLLADENASPDASPDSDASPTEQGGWLR